MNYAKTVSAEQAVTVDASALAAQPATEFAVLADQVSVLYRQSRLDLAITLVLSTVAMYALWDPLHAALLVPWWLGTAALAAARFALVLAYERSARAQEPHWLRWHAIGALAAGALWGWIAALYFPSETGQRQAFMSFLIAGVLASGIPVYCAVWWVYAVFGGVLIAPLVGVLAASGDRQFLEVALVIPLVYALSVVIAVRLSRVFSDAFRLRRAHARLAEDHAGLNAQLQEQMEELLQAQTEVAASGRKLALFAERAPIAVFELDRNGTILEMNPAAEHVFGYSAIELGGRSLPRTLFPEGEALAAAQWWEDFVAGSQPASGVRARCLRRDAIEIMCEFSLTPLVNFGGELISIIVQTRDITQQLEAERLKKEFTSTLSHELRTPLTSIIGSLQLINSGMFGEVDKDIADLTLVAERNGQRLLDLINDILDIEKIESGKFTLAPEQVALGELVKESLVLNRAFAHNFDVRLALDGELPAVAVHADRKRLLQVMTNLISNAAKFSPKGGQVDVAVTPGNATVKVTVADRGPGIPQEFRSRIFSRFAQADSAYTRQKGGTGLGLAICKRLIELMDGSVGFRDREGGGTVFYFDLPLLAQPAMPS